MITTIEKNASPRRNEKPSSATISHHLISIPLPFSLIVLHLSIFCDHQTQQTMRGKGDPFLDLFVSKVRMNQQQIER